jgi:site-specific DNA-methyltransferase (adenine-specific)
MLMHVGNCIEWLEQLEDASVDHCITDPPYSEHVHAKSLSAPLKVRNATKRKNVRPQPRKRDLGFTSLTPALQRDVAIELARITRRWVIVFCDPEAIGTWRFALAGAGLDVVRVGVWIKPNGAPQFTGDRPGTGYETVVIAHRKGRKWWNGGGKHAVWVHPIATGGYGRERVHSTQKPLPLLLELIEQFTDPGELVIDPFAGSGSTGVAACRLGRRFAGAELDPDMAALAAEQIAAEGEGLSVTCRRAGQLPLLAPPERIVLSVRHDGTPLVAEVQNGAPE